MDFSNLDISCIYICSHTQVASLYEYINQCIMDYIVTTPLHAISVTAMDQPLPTRWFSALLFVCLLFWLHHCCWLRNTLRDVVQQQHLLGIPSIMISSVEKKRMRPWRDGGGFEREVRNGVVVPSTGGVGGGQGRASRSSTPTQTRPKFGPEMDRGRQKKDTHPFASHVWAAFLSMRIKRVAALELP